MNLVGWRTVISAALLALLRLAVAQGWVPDVDESDVVASLDQILDLAWKVFLALKGNRLLDKL